MKGCSGAGATADAELGLTTPASQVREVDSTGLCAMECGATPNCTAWTLSKKTGGCWLKDARDVRPIAQNRSGAPAHPSYPSPAPLLCSLAATRGRPRDLCAAGLISGVRASAGGPNPFEALTAAVA